MNAGEVPYTKQETKSLSEKNLLRSKASVVRPAAPEDFSRGRDGSCDLVKLPLHQNSQHIRWNCCPSRNSVLMENRTSMCTWRTIRPWEVWLKTTCRRQHSPAAHPPPPPHPHPPNPLSKDFTLTRKIEILHPHSLKSSHYLDLGGPTLSQTLGLCMVVVFFFFLHRRIALKWQILMTKTLCTHQVSSAWFEMNLSAKMKFRGRGKLLHTLAYQLHENGKAGGGQFSGNGFLLLEDYHEEPLGSPRGSFGVLNRGK